MAAVRRLCVVLLVAVTHGLTLRAVPSRARSIRMQGPPPGTPGGPPAVAGGPPPGTPGGPPAAAGGPPPGTPGGPPGGGAGGPPAGGPPPRTAAQKLVDGLFEAVFPLLYAFELDGMLDSEKNLRVLWVRALLAAAGELNDDVASELLPSASRWVVSAPLARTIWAPALPKLEWIKQRTEFIDETVDSFLAANAGASPQVVLIGAGYDTRALRYRTSAARFFEVDLPSVLPVKEAMATRFLDAEGGAARSVGAEGRALGVDLNKATMAPPGVFAQLSGLGLDRSLPTLVVSEATRRARARPHACTRARTTLARPQLPTRPALHSLAGGPLLPLAAREARAARGRGQLRRRQRGVRARAHRQPRALCALASQGGRRRLPLAARPRPQGARHALGWRHPVRARRCGCQALNQLRDET